MPLDIRDESVGDNITLTLYLEGAPWARAHLGGDVFEQMHAQLGSERGDLVAELRTALQRLHAHTLERSSGACRKSALKAGASSRRMSSGDRKSRQVSLYDLGTASTGPLSVPALVRNKLRYAVHEKLVKGGPIAEQLLRATGLRVIAPTPPMPPLVLIDTNVLYDFFWVATRICPCWLRLYLRNRHQWSCSRATASVAQCSENWARRSMRCPRRVRWRTFDRADHWKSGVEALRGGSRQGNGRYSAVCVHGSIVPGLGSRDV